MDMLSYGGEINNNVTEVEAGIDMDHKKLAHLRTIYLRIINDSNYRQTVDKVTFVLCKPELGYETHEKIIYQNVLPKGSPEFEQFQIIGAKYSIYNKVFPRFLESCYDIKIRSVEYDESVEASIKKKVDVSNEKLKIIHFIRHIKNIKR